LTDDDQWRRTESPPSGPPGPPQPPRPPQRGPSAPPDARFNPLATAIGVFTGVAIPVVVIGYTRPAGVNTLIIVIGVIIGLLAGVVAGIWVDHRNGRVWRGPQL
jgi:hypothetical protein